MSLPRPLRLHGVLLASLAVLIAVAVSPIASSLLTRLALGWIGGVFVFVAATLTRMAHAKTVDVIRSRAADLDQAGAAVLPISLLAALASIVVVVGEAAKGQGAPLHDGLLALGTVALSWTFVHLMFALHYAHAFYQQVPTGAKGAQADRKGLIFPGED
ncbi:hypothetical protein LTR94_031204, partial [Friedmanniomyces endolithicus]